MRYESHHENHIFLSESACFVYAIINRYSGVFRLMDFILNMIKAVLYGIVQGITEWLPISSTGHLILMNSFLPLDVYADAQANLDFWNMFKVVIQFGSILADEL